jgi:hypothetical protein
MSNLGLAQSPSPNGVKTLNPPGAISKLLRLLQFRMRVASGTLRPIRPAFFIHPSGIAVVELRSPQKVNHKLSALGPPFP